MLNNLSYNILNICGCGSGGTTKSRRFKGRLLLFTEMMRLVSINFSTVNFKNLPITAK